VNLSAFTGFLDEPLATAFAAALTLSRDTVPRLGSDLITRYAMSFSLCLLQSISLREAVIAFRRRGPHGPSPKTRSRDCSARRPGFIVWRRGA
jgi:hypothetical protein